VVAVVVPAAPAPASGVDPAFPVGFDPVPVDAPAPALAFDVEPGTTVSSSGEVAVSSVAVAPVSGCVVADPDVLSGTAFEPAAPGAATGSLLPQVPQNSASSSLAAWQTSQIFTE
jgi:hypothetical protein